MKKVRKVALAIWAGASLLPVWALAQRAPGTPTSPDPVPTSTAEPAPTAIPRPVASPTIAPSPTASPTSVPETPLNETTPQRHATANPNSSPALTAGPIQITQGALTVLPGTHVKFYVPAQDNDTDVNGNSVPDTVYFHWAASGGSLNRGGAGDSTANTADWTAPDVPNTYTIQVNVNDTAYNGFKQTGVDSDIIGGRHAKDPLNDTPLPTLSISIRVIPRITKIQFLGNDNLWYDWSGTKSVLKNRTIRLRAWSSKANGTFPGTYPEWQVSTGIFAQPELYGGFRTLLVTFTQTSTALDDLKTVTAKVLTESKTADSVVGEIVLDKVDFQDNYPIEKDDGSDTYGTPIDASTVAEWVSGGEASPLCYHGGQSIKAKAYFKVMPTGFDATGYTVRGRGLATARNKPGGAVLNLPAAKLAMDSGSAIYGPGVTLPMSSTTNLFNPYTVKWDVKLNNAWYQVGESSNKIYRVWKAPMSPDGKLFETVVDVACRDTQTYGDASNIVDNLFKTFKSRTVDNARSHIMRYWANESDEARLDLAASDCQKETEMILPGPRMLPTTVGGPHLEDMTGVGTCLAWAKLFTRCIACHGISGAAVIELKPDAKFITDVVRGSDIQRGDFLVKNWTFNSPGHPPAGSTPFWTHSGTDVLDQPGLPGQGYVADPPGSFFNHFIVKYGGSYYDPSYGTGKVSAAGWETASIAGFRNWWAPGVKVTKMNGPSQEMSFVPLGAPTPPDW